jgi:dihydrofolate reductase
MAKTLHLIAACSENRVIGRAERLPWRIQTWPGAKAQGRHPIVVTKDGALADKIVSVAPSFSEAVRIAENLPGDIYICGGQRIYEEAMRLAATEERSVRLLLTLVHATIEGDRFFPEWRHLPWRELSRRESADDNFRYTFLDLALG